MKKPWQALQMMPHIRKNDSEFLVIVRAREPNPLHTLINRHGWSLPAVMTPKSAREGGVSQTLEQTPDQCRLFERRLVPDCAVATSTSRASRPSIPHPAKANARWLMTVFG